MKSHDPVAIATEQLIQARVDLAVAEERERGFRQIFLVSLGWLFLLVVVVLVLR